MRKHLQPGQTQQQSTREASEADSRKGEENVTSIYSPCWFSITICCLLVLTRAEEASPQGKMLWRPPSMPGFHQPRNTRGVRSTNGQTHSGTQTKRLRLLLCHFPLTNGRFFVFFKWGKKPFKRDGYIGNLNSYSVPWMSMTLSSVAL